MSVLYHLLFHLELSISGLCINRLYECIQDIDHKRDSDDPDIRVAHLILGSVVQIELRKDKQVVLDNHYHAFIKNLQFRSVHGVMGFRTGVKDYVYRGQEQQQLDFQEGEVEQEGGYGHKDDSASHEDGVVPDVGTVPVNMDVLVQV